MDSATALKIEAKFTARRAFTDCEADLFDARGAQRRPLADAMRKLEAANKTHAIVKAIQAGLIDS